jgi:type I restriction enzyme S subunit
MTQKLRPATTNPKIHIPYIHPHNSHGSHTSHHSHPIFSSKAAAQSQTPAMRKPWPTKTLGEACQIKPPKAEARARLRADDLVSFAPMENLGIDKKNLVPSQVRPLASVAGSYTYFAEGDVLLAKITPCFENGKLGIATELSNGIGFGSSEFIVFRPRECLDKEFLYYYLSRPDFRAEGAARMGGAVGQQRLPKEFIENYVIPVPPLSEQQRIVRILDEAFESIAKAKVAAEQNVANSRALFESHLSEVFTTGGEGWFKTTVGEQLTLQRGFDITKNQQKEGAVPVVSSGGIKSFHNKALVQPPGVVIGRKGTLGKTFYLDQAFWPHDTTLWVKDFKENNPRFVFYLFLGLDVQGLDSGTANPALNRNQVHPIPIYWAPLRQQNKDVATLDRLLVETQHLVSAYQRKLAALEELKKSLLHQAFSGQL